MSTEPITGLTYQAAGSQQTDALQNAELNYYGAWLNCVVLSVGDTTPPGSPANGDRYIVGASATGAWATHDDELAIYRDGWQFYAPPAAGVPIVKNLDDGADWECSDAGVWSAKSGGGVGSTTTLVTEASAFTAESATHAGTNKLILAGGDATFDNAQTYASGDTFNIRATAAIELIEDGVTLTPPAGGTLELDTAMSVTVVMTGATTGLVIGQTVPA